MYTYKNVSVPFEKGMGVKTGDGFKKCMDVIEEQAKDGWRLAQVIVPPNEKMGVMSAYAYEIVFEKTV